MTVITNEHLHNAQAMIDKLVMQGKTLFQDITETVEDRDRLIDELAQRDKTIERLNSKISWLESELTAVNACMATIREATVAFTQVNGATAREEAMVEMVAESQRLNLP